MVLDVIFFSVFTEKITFSNERYAVIPFRKPAKEHLWEQEP